MRALFHWLYHNLWQASVDSGQSLRVSVLVADAKPDGAVADIVLKAPSFPDAVQLVRHLARLGTIREVTLLGLDGLPAKEQRQLEFLTIEVRGLGLRLV